MNMVEIENKIEQAIKNILYGNQMLEADKGVDKYIYNEISLQNELGIELRRIFKNENIRIFFERNVKNCSIKEEYIKKMVKKEVDLYIYDKKNDEAYAIELKFVKKENHRIPENLYDFVKDMRFMEQLKENAKEHKNNSKIITTYVLTIVDDGNYIESKDKNCIGIYQYFRNNKGDNNEKHFINIDEKTIIVKPTKNKNLKNNGEHEEMLNVIKDEQNNKGKQGSLKKIIEKLKELKEGVIYIKLNENWNLEWQKIEIRDKKYYAYCGKVTGNKYDGYKVKNVNITKNRG